MSPDRFGVDEIRRVEHYGRYLIKAPVPRRFIWEKHREREIECPLIQWRIGDKWFAAVIPIEPNHLGLMDEAKAVASLRSLIDVSRS